MSDDKYINELTPIEAHEGIQIKRDDLFQVAGQHGGKARTCWHLSQGAIGLITAGSRQSPQVAITAAIAQRLDIPCRVHVPSGKFTPQLESAEKCGAKVIQHKPGYNSVIISRSKKDAAEKQWTEIPFGMECQEAVYQTAQQVKNIPDDIKRIIVSVGSGMSLAGILYGLKQIEREIPVCGIVVGANPIKRLGLYASNWQNECKLIPSELDYHQHAPNTYWGDVQLDPIYEAKCIPYFQEGDLFWVVGCREL